MTSGLYIHIPFCVKKCNYCDFYSIGGKNTVADEYITAVKNEIKKFKNYKKEYGEKLTLSAHMIIEFGNKAWVLYAGNEFFGFVADVCDRA